MSKGTRNLPEVFQEFQESGKALPKWVFQSSSAIQFWENHGDSFLELVRLKPDWLDNSFEHVSSTIFLQSLNQASTQQFENCFPMIMDASLLSAISLEKYWKSLEKSEELESRKLSIARYFLSKRSAFEALKPELQREVSRTCLYSHPLWNKQDYSNFDENLKSALSEELVNFWNQYSSELQILYLQHPGGLWSEFLKQWIYLVLLGKNESRDLLLQLLGQYHQNTILSSRQFPDIQARFPKLLESAQIAFQNDKEKLLDCVKQEMLSQENFMKLINSHTTQVFPKELAFTVVVTLLFCWFFDWENVYYWMSLTAVLNFVEAWFAFLRPYKPYYLFKFKLQGLKFMKRTPTEIFSFLALMGFEPEEVRLKILWNSMKQDSWYVFPLLKC